MDRTIGATTDAELAAHAALGGTPTPRRYSSVTMRDGRTGTVVGYETDAPVALVQLDGSGAAERPILRVPFADLMKAFTCSCGAMQFDTREEALAAQPHGEFKCPTCRTFAKDHEFVYVDEEGRCLDCDTRYYSHGSPAAARKAVAA